MKIIEKNDEKLSFIEEIDESLANAIRRSALEVPILAVDEVEFHKNDSVLYDEVLALRLGLLPLEMSKKILLEEKCTCKGKGCAKCSVQLKLQAKGPCTVYAKELKGKVKPVYEEIPIVELGENQELEFVVKAKLGDGIEHTKYSPGVVYYRNIADIEIDKDCEDCKKCIGVCPNGVFKIEKDKISIVDKNKCDLCESCVEECKRVCKNKNCIKIEPSKELIFFIESFGQISAKEILEKAIKALKDNLKQVAK